MDAETILRRARGVAAVKIDARVGGGPALVCLTQRDLGPAVRPGDGPQSALQPTRTDLARARGSSSVSKGPIEPRNTWSGNNQSHVDAVGAHLIGCVTPHEYLKTRRGVRALLLVQDLRALREAVHHNLLSSFRRSLCTKGLQRDVGRLAHQILLNKRGVRGVGRSVGRREGADRATHAAQYQVKGEGSTAPYNIVATQRTVIFCLLSRMD